LFSSSLLRSLTTEVFFEVSSFFYDFVSGFPFHFSVLGLFLNLKQADSFFGVYQTEWASDEYFSFVFAFFLLAPLHTVECMVFFS